MAPTSVSAGFISLLVGSAAAWDDIRGRGFPRAAPYGVSNSSSSTAPTSAPVYQSTTATSSASESSVITSTLSAQPSGYTQGVASLLTSASAILFSYAPTTGTGFLTTGTGPLPTATANPLSSSTATNGTCGGATLNVLDASLDWWYTTTFEFAVSTLSLQYNAQDSLTGWTLLPATTTFDITSALEQATCTPTLVTGSVVDFTFVLTQDDCFTSPTPVAAATTVVTVDAYTTVNETSGTGTSLPAIVITPPPAVITIPQDEGAFTFGTPFVYFSAYEIVNANPTTYGNGSSECIATTSVYGMSEPFSFEYTGPDVNGSREVGADVTGDVAPAFLGVVNVTSAVAGSWVAAPTVAFVVDQIIEAVAVLATTSVVVPLTIGETSALSLDLPTATLPISVTTTQGGTFTSGRFTVHIESTGVSLDLPTGPTPAEDKTTGKSTSAVTTASPATTTTALSVLPFAAQLGSSELTLDLPAPSTQSVVTVDVSGQQLTATRIQTTADAGSGSNTAGGSGLGVLISDVISAAAQPTDAAQVLSDAENTFPASVGAAASAIIAGIGGSGSSSSGSSGSSSSVSSGSSGSDNGAQPDTLSPSPAQVITVAGVTATASTSPVFVVAGQTATPGGAPITVSGTVISVPASATAIVIGGSTVALVGAASASAITAGGLTITESPNPAFTIAGQTLSAGGSAIVVSGITISLASGGSAVVVDGTTSVIATKDAASAIPLLTIGSHTFTANAASQYLIGSGETLTPGGTVVADGTTISLAADGSTVVVNGQRQTLPPASITSAPALTIDGTIYEPNSGSTYDVNGQLLTPGGVITITGSSGVETISLDQSGSSIVEAASGHTITSVIAPTAAPILTVGGETFTAMSANGGSPSYLIDGQTLTPGEVETVTIKGQTYIISLSAQETVLEIEMVGAGGKVTATSYETLFPATLSYPTEYMTVTASSSSKGSATTGAETSATGKGNGGAGLQNTAAPAAMTWISGMLAFGCFALAIWL